MAYHGYIQGYGSFSTVLKAPTIDPPAPPPRENNYLEAPLSLIIMQDSRVYNKASINLEIPHKPLLPTGP